MANKKINYSKPSKSSSGLNFKVRFDFNGKKFIVTNKKRKKVGSETFNSHDKALEHAKKLHNETS